VFSEPLNVVMDGTTIALPRVTMEKFRSGWGDPSGELSATIAHSLSTNEQSQVRIDLKKTIADPLNTGKNIPVQASAWLVVRAPQNQLGFTDADLSNLAKGITTLVNSTGFLTHFLQKES
jgi:hypothetical protein